MKWKIFIPTMLLVASGFATFSVLTYINTKQTLEKMTYSSLEQESVKTSEDILKEIQRASIEVDSMARLVQAWVDNKLWDRNIFQMHFKYWAESNKYLKGTWADWVPLKFGNDADKLGRFNFFWARDEKNTTVLQEPYKWEDVKDQEYFTAPQVVKDQIMVSPYLDTINGQKTLLTSISTPIYDKGDFLGVIGCDFGIASIQKTFEATRPFEKGLSRLLTNHGKIAADIDSKNLTQDWPVKSEIKTIQEKMKSGKPFYLQSYEPYLKEEAVKYFRPLQMGRSPYLWYYASVVPMSALKKESNTLFVYQIGGALVVTIMIGALMWFIVSMFSNKIEKIAENVGSGADEVSNVSKELEETQNDLAVTNKQQADLVSQTSASINEISNSISISAIKTEESGKLLRECMEKGENGNQMVVGMLDSISKIKESNVSMIDQMERNFEEISSIISVINAIQEKTNIINDIVFQTKLLAFNASVEAARAGEFGKGFSVVAEEVGNLASMSGQASKDITGIIMAGSEKIKSIIAATKSSNSRMSEENLLVVDRGASVAKKCGEVLVEIIEGIQAVSGNANEVQEAIVLQNREAQEINKATQVLDEVSEKSTDITNRISETVVTLGKQSGGLGDQVRELKKIIKGS